MVFRHSGYIQYIYNNNYIYISYSFIRFSNICVCDVLRICYALMVLDTQCGDIVVKKTTTSLTPEVFDYTSQCYLPGSSIFWAFACVGFLAFQLSSFPASITVLYTTWYAI